MGLVGKILKESILIEARLDGDWKSLVSRDKNLTLKPKSSFFFSLVLLAFTNISARASASLSLSCQ